MTAVRTKFEAGYYAVTASSTRYLILDQFQQINVAVLDDFSTLFASLRIDPQKQFSVELLINACIFFALSKEIGLQPGLFSDGDAAILAHCRRRISADVMDEDHEILIQELIKGWQTIVKSTLARKYVKLGEYLCAEENQSACQFSAMGGFTLFVQDYFTGCTRAFIRDAPTELSLMMKFCNLLHSNASGIGFHHNRFSQVEIFLKQTTAILPEINAEREVLITFLRREKKNYETLKACCYISVVGWAQIELSEIEEFADAAQAIAELLQKRPFTTTNSALKCQLNDLREQLMVTSAKMNPLLRNCQFSKTPFSLEEQHVLIQEAVHYAIIDYARKYIFKSHGKHSLAELPLYYLAGQGIAAEERLIALLLDSSQAGHLKPFEWYAILQNAKSEALIELSQQTIARHSLLEAHADLLRDVLYHSLPISFVLASAIMPFGLLLQPSSSVLVRGAPITHQYRRLEQAVKGSPPKQRLGRFTLPPSHASDSSSQNEVDGLADSLQETLDLQEKSSGCIVM